MLILIITNLSLEIYRHMTTMIPEICVDTNPAAQTLHQNLYNQLGPDYKIVQYLKQPKEGHIFLLDSEKHRS